MKTLLILFFSFFIACAPFQGAEATSLDKSLFEALKAGDLALVKQLVQKGADINRKNRKGGTYLNLVSTLGHLDIVKYLVEHHQFKPDSQPKKFRSPLFYAAMGGSLDVVKYLADKGADLHKRNRFGSSYLDVAATFGHLQLVTYLVEERKFEVDRKDRQNRTALYHACQGGSLEVFQYLESKGADSGWINEDGESYLMCAGPKGGFGIVKYLIDEKKFKVDQKTGSGQTPLFYACQNGALDIVKFLVAKGAEVNHTDESKMTPLFLAMATKNLEVTRFLVENGAAINVRDAEGRTPLMMAVLGKHSQTASYLVANGAQVTIAEKEGYTALHFAIINKDFSVTELLIGQGADVNARNERGETPLFLAVVFNHLDTVKLLVKNGSSLHTKTQKGKGLLDVARGSVKEYLTGLQN